MKSAHCVRRSVTLKPWSRSPPKPKPASVQEMEDLFEEDDEVEGMFVDGEALMDLLADGLGLLLNPEDESAAVIDPELAKLIAA
jgi:hypothetical protein